jgi:predicted site-specific integrase-resolvase
MSQAAAATKALTGYKRDVMDLLGISEQTYKTYLDAGLLKPIAGRAGKRRVFSLTAIIKKFEL